ncbi:MAG: alpha/beta hydrolase [Gemmatimonadaceae bacterium]|nr:alpha/beta hydrolase [Gemmatimonadaceae bacterium]
MRGEFVDVGGVRLYCYAFGQRGAGHPIVLIHGCFTSSRLWQDVLPRLPKGHRVLVLDLLGHGRSDPPGAASMTVAGHTQRVATLLDIMGLREAILVGHGMGAAIAARVAHTQPERVSQLMLVNPALLTNVPRDAYLTRRIQRVAALVPLWKRLSPTWMASALHAALLPCFAHRDVGARSLDVYLKPFMLRQGRDAACAQLTALAASRYDSVDTLAPNAIRCETSLVVGSTDPFLRDARLRRLRDALQDATLRDLGVHVLPGVAHVAPEEAPDRLGTLVGELLAR